MTLDQKQQILEEILAHLGSTLVAFSGGVDSTYLLWAARKVLGADRVVALTATSPTYPVHEFEESRSLAAAIGVRQLVVASNELDIPGFADNSPQRCYLCKQELFALAVARAAELGLAVVLDGANLDDLDDFRPGREATRELGVRSPLLEAGLGKDEIRELSRRASLPTADKQPFACLASRFPYGTRITAERLRQIDRCETFLREQGFGTYRVRFHGEVARIEVGSADMPRLLDQVVRSTLVATCKAAGFTYVALDLEGYRSGSMNAVLADPEKS